MNKVKIENFLYFFEITPFIEFTEKRNSDIDNSRFSVIWNSRIGRKNGEIFIS